MTDLASAQAAAAGRLARWKANGRRAPDPAPPAATDDLAGPPAYVMADGPNLEDSAPGVAAKQPATAKPLARV